jgi:hypothetical protein
MIFELDKVVTDFHLGLAKIFLASPQSIID